MPVILASRAANTLTSILSVRAQFFTLWPESEDAMENTGNWQRGVILWFNLGKGMGIIRPENNKEDDVRFDSASIGRDVEQLEGGLHVEYLAEQELIGRYATRIRIISGESV